MGFAWWGLLTNQEREGVCLRGQEAGGEQTGRMDRWVVGSKLFPLAHGNAGAAKVAGELAKNSSCLAPGRCSF